MDFLDPKKKRAHEIRLFIGYFLVGILLLIATSILVFQASGYDVDRKTGAVIQNGLLFLDAHPESANVYLNGQKKGQTDARYVLPAGAYDIELRRDGYRTWKQKLALEGSTIERFVHPFLFPVDLKSKDLKAYQAGHGLFTTSPDHKWLIVQQPGSLSSFDVVDLNNKSNPLKQISLADGLLTLAEATHALEVVEWSTDNRRLLLKHNYGENFEFIILDRESPALSVNINKTLGATYSAVRLLDKKFDKLYLYTAEGGVLQTADLKSKLVTPLLTGVLAFQPHGDDLLMYVTNESTSEGKVAVRLRERLSTYTLRELPANSNYLLELARYDGRWHMVASATSEGRAYIYENPFDDLKKDEPKRPIPSVVLRTENAQFLSFSNNARFIALQGGGNFSVYDAETERSHQYSTGLQLDAGQKATWMDGHRLTINAAGKMTVFDYNGTNLQTLVDILPGITPSFDRDYNALFTIAQANERTVLRRTEMRLQPL